MGCHTWMLTECKEDFASIKCRVKSNIENHIKKIDDGYYGDLDSDILFNKRYNERILSLFDKLSNDTIYELASLNLKDEFKRHYHYDKFTKQLFVDLSGENKTPKSEWYHDVFRIGNYPEDKLYSYLETINFINKNKKSIYSHVENWENKLKEFWQKHPKGLIYFG